jgi:hypothetical protein
MTNSPENSCISSTSITLINIIRSAVSIPNIGLLLKVSSLILIVDEFSYFAYRRSAYDSVFGSFSELCWNWTNAKWVPPSILTDSLKINLASNDDYSKKWLQHGKKVTPNHFQSMKEDIIFSLCSTNVNIHIYTA